MTKWTISFVLVLLTVSFDMALGYDKHLGKFPPAEEVIAKSVVVVSCWGTGEGTKLVFNKEKKDFDKFKAAGTFAQNGLGVVVSNRGCQYIVTNAHVVTPLKLMVGEDSVTVKNVTHSVLRAADYYRKYAPCPVALCYKSEKYDLALLQVPEYWIAFEPISIPIGQCSKLEPEDALAGILKGRNGGTTFGYGKVELEGSRYVGNAVRFTMSMKVREGDSGSPVFAYDNGKPVWVGIVTAYLELKDKNYYVSIATRADLITNAISRSERPSHSLNLQRSR